MTNLSGLEPTTPTLPEALIMLPVRTEDAKDWGDLTNVQCKPIQN
jgi:hypothetical protein